MKTESISNIINESKKFNLEFCIITNIQKVKQDGTIDIKTYSTFSKYFAGSEQIHSTITCINDYLILYVIHNLGLSNKTYMSTVYIPIDSIVTIETISIDQMDKYFEYHRIMNELNKYATAQ